MLTPEAEVVRPDAPATVEVPFPAGYGVVRPAETTAVE